MLIRLPISDYQKKSKLRESETPTVTKMRKVKETRVLTKMEVETERDGKTKDIEKFGLRPQ